MSNVTQTIPSYIAGISQQPDEFKIPGQVNVATNVFPDITEGLSKRPGTRFIKQLDPAGNGTDFQDLGKWFHYYRDEDEQYLGQISRAGDVNMWRCNTMTINGVTYEAGSPVIVRSSADSSAMATYLTHTADQDIQTLTLNDHTYLTNRTKTTAMSSTKEPARPSEAFIELKKVAYASQYAVNLFDDTTTTTVTTATRIRVELVKSSNNSCDVNGFMRYHSASGITNAGDSRTDSGYRCDKSALDGRDSYSPNVGTRIFSISDNQTLSDDNAIGGKVNNTSMGSVRIDNQGSDYDMNNTTLTPASGNATLQPVWSSGKLIDVNITNAGTNYSTNTGDVSITFANQGSGINAEAFLIKNTNTDYSYTVQVKKADGTDNNSAKDLNFRITTTGQSVPFTEGTDTTYQARYTTTHDLLHGGTGWLTGDYFYIWMKDGYYKVTIEEISTSKVQANLGLIRPTPTSFDTKTTVTAESILGQLQTDIIAANSTWDAWALSGLETKDTVGVKIIGNGIYIRRDVNTKFNVSTPVGELLNVLSSEVKDVADLPKQCRHGYVVKVSNSEAEEDDYYVKFIGKLKTGGDENDDNDYLDGEGVWEECAMPDTDIEFDKGTMPLALIRTSNGDFRLTQLDGTTYKAGNIHTITRNSINVSTGHITITSHGYTNGQKVYYHTQGGGQWILNSNLGQDGSEYFVRVIDANTIGLNIGSHNANSNLNFGNSGNRGNDNQTLSNITDNTDYKTPEWDNAQVGDTSVDGTNPRPSFIGKTINKMLFFRNRFVLLSDENVIMSRPGDFTNFWAKSAITYTATDPIDISCSSEYPAIIYDGIQVNTGLVLFTKNQQFMLTTDSDVLSPLTAKINFISAYNFNHKTNPFSLGTTIGFIDNVGQHSRLMEMARVLREGEPDVIEQSKVVSELLDRDLNLVSVSKENGFVALSEKDKKTLYCYKYFNTSDKRVHQAWFTWKFQWQIQHHFIIDDSLYLVLNTENSDTTDNNGKCMLIKLDLKLHSDTLQTYTGIETDKEDIHSVYLDCATSVSIASNTYNASTNKTTFPLPSNWWTTEAEGGDMVLYETGDDDANGTNDPVGRYTEVTINGSNVEVVGDWSSTTVVLGILYEMEVEFPKIYPTSQQGESVISDTRGSLVLHRNKINLGASGLYQTILKRKGKITFTEDHESVIANYSEANELPTQQLQTKVIPIYDRNINTTLTLKSKHPTPLTLYSMTWEGDYTNKFYSSV